MWQPKSASVIVEKKYALCNDPIQFRALMRHLAAISSIHKFHALLMKDSIRLI